jgi:hypothetical protein
MNSKSVVIPAKAGIPFSFFLNGAPAFAGATVLPWN